VLTLFHQVISFEATMTGKYASGAKDMIDLVSAVYRYL
jgi:hypothetical protein